MSISYEDAIDEIFALFNEAWNAKATAVAGYVPEVRWPGVEEPDKLDYAKFWARVSQQTVLDEQNTLKNEDVCYTTDGLVFIQIFCPKSNNLSMTEGRQLATIARNASSEVASRSRSFIIVGSSLFLNQKKH